MAQRPDRKRLGKKHRDASTRPKKGRAQRVTPTTGAVDPRKRKVLATKKAEAAKKKRTPTRSPENESRKTIAPKPEGRAVAPRISRTPPANESVGRQPPRSTNIGKEEDWRDIELLAAQMNFERPPPAADISHLPLIA